MTEGNNPKTRLTDESGAVEIGSLPVHGERPASGEAFARYKKIQSDPTRQAERGRTYTLGLARGIEGNHPEDNPQNS